MKFKPFYLFQALIILAVIAAIITGFVIVGSPSQERAKRLDDQRSNDLQSISSAIDQYYNANGRYMLPPTLDALRAEPNVYISSLVDPVSGKEYGYQNVSSTAYQLCATFETDPSRDMSPTPYPMTAIGHLPGSPWDHGVGNTCFPFKVTLWPVPPKTQ